MALMNLGKYGLNQTIQIFRLLSKSKAMHSIMKYVKIFKKCMIICEIC